MTDQLIQNRFEELRERALALGNHPDLDRPVSRWVTANDSHLPQKFLTSPVRQLLEPRRWKAVRETPSIGATRLNRLLDLVARALDSAAGRGTSGVAAGPAVVTGAGEFDLDALDEARWSIWREAIRRHRLDGLPLGRFARSLNELGGTLWDIPLRRFLDLPLAEASGLAGIGRVRGWQVLRAIAEVAAAVAAVPAGSSLACRPTAARIHGIAFWIEGVLTAGTVPEPDELDREFVRPVLAQLSADLSAEHGELIRRRWGVGGRAATLQEMADEVGKTREWVRLVTDAAEQVMAVRWPEGRYLLGDFYELLLSDAGATRQQAVVRIVAEGAFGILFPADGARRLSTRGRRPSEQLRDGP